MSFSASLKRFNDNPGRSISEKAERGGEDTEKLRWKRRAQQQKMKETQDHQIKAGGGQSPRRKEPQNEY